MNLENESRRRRAGLLLVAIGVVDIGAMAAIVAAGHSYASSLNVFAVVAGIFVIRNNAFAIRVVTKYFAVIAGLAAGLPLILFAFSDTVWFMMRHEPATALAAIVYYLFVFSGLFLALHYLRDVDIYRPAWEAGGRRRILLVTPLHFLSLGAVLGLILGVFAIWLASSDAAQIAVAQALRAHGREAEAVLTGLGMSGGERTATVAVADETGLATYTVTWTADDGSDAVVSGNPSPQAASRQ